MPPTSQEKLETPKYFQIEDNSEALGSEEEEEQSDLELDSNSTFHVKAATLKGNNIEQESKEQNSDSNLKRKSEISSETISEAVPKKRKKSCNKWKLI